VAPRPGVAVIINPISGTGGHPGVARERMAVATGALSRHRIDAGVFVTDHAGHAPSLAREAIANGASLVIAWGGDGTINEVASELAFRDVALGIIPSGSGNGLSRELGIPFHPAAAFDVALAGKERVIDAGELDGRLFFNVAGFGFDARVAHEFAKGGQRRGFSRYLKIATRELFTFEPHSHTVVADGQTIRTRALLIAFANGRQYGNGALIAPQARLDDGALDVVVVAYRSPLKALVQVPFVFAGRINSLSGVVVQRACDVAVSSTGPVMYHVDGEPFIGGESVRGRVRPRALRVRVP
jgi:YegS/Rv2252/BmrU family lipid kinase